MNAPRIDAEDAITPEEVIKNPFTFEFFDPREEYSKSELKRPSSANSPTSPRTLMLAFGSDSAQTKPENHARIFAPVINRIVARQHSRNQHLNFIPLYFEIDYCISVISGAHSGCSRDRSPVHPTSEADLHTYARGALLRLLRRKLDGSSD